MGTMYRQAMINGSARSTNGEFDPCVIFPDGARPILGWRGRLIPIDEPERFGRWETPKERDAYARKFLSS